MSRSNDEEKSHLEHVQENFDLLFARMNDLGTIQQDMKELTKTSAKVDQCTTDQQYIAQQVRANGQAVAQLTLRQFEEDAKSMGNESVSVIFEEEPPFTNVFAEDKGPHKTEQPKSHKYKTEQHKPGALPHHTLPKMHFPPFDGTSPHIWIDKCQDYFTMYNIPEHLWMTAASMHLDGNAAKWFRAFKRNHPTISWKQFCDTVQTQFGSDDYRTAINDLIALTHYNSGGIY